MNDSPTNDVKLAPPPAVMQAARDFAAALAATPQYLALEVAGDKLDQDPAAQEIIQAFQAKQQELKMMQSLNAISPDERDEFERLRLALHNHPSIAAYLQAQAGLVSICQAAGDLLTEHTGMNFGSSACSSGCCG